MENDMDLIRLAAMTAGSLKQVDNDMVQRSATSGPAVKIDPRNFIKKAPAPVQQQKYNLVPDAAFVEKPVSRPMGSDVHGTINVDVNSLLIPMPEGMEKYSNSEIVQSTAPENRTPISNQVETHIKSPVATTALDDKLSKLEKKMNKIIRLLSKNGK